MTHVEIVVESIADSIQITDPAGFLRGLTAARDQIEAERVSRAPGSTPVNVVRSIVLKHFKIEDVVTSKLIKARSGTQYKSLNMAFKCLSKGKKPILQIVSKGAAAPLVEVVYRRIR